MSKINLGSSSVPVREIRLGSITGYAGTARDLVGKARRDCLREQNRSFSQCLGCSTSNAACTVILIPDAAVISHGPVGCAGCLHEFAFTYRVNGIHRGILAPAPRRIFSTNIEEKDTVYGGSEKLSVAIREVYHRVKPAALFIITTGTLNLKLMNLFASILTRILLKGESRRIETVLLGHRTQGTRAIQPPSRGGYIKMKGFSRVNFNVLVSS